MSRGGGPMSSASGNSQNSTSINKRVNDSVYELHTPQTTELANMDILFFHDLQLEEKPDIHIETWRSRCAEKSVWPKEWLPEKFPSACIFSISYDGSMKKNDKSGRMDLNLVGESLLVNLVLAEIGQVRPVILIGHGFGGLVIKQLCLLAHKKSIPEAPELHGETHGQKEQALLQNIEGIFYYGTPHHGSRRTNKEEEFSIGEGELVNYLRVFSKDLARLNQDFDILRNHFRWHISGVGEVLPTDLGGGKLVVLVEEASARCSNFIAVADDHISICQPKEKQSTTYQVLVNFIQDVQLKISSSRYDSQSFVEDLQRVPITLIGALDSFEEGEIHQELKSSSVVGLWGMGGIGKTTLSKVAFNYLHPSFEYTIFVENVKLLLGDAKDLERMVLDKVHHWGRKMRKVSDKPILARLRGKNLLAVVDDVENERDIEVVGKLREISSASSCFILTSRDRQILDEVEGISIVEVKVLDDVSSETLFRSYAISPSNKALLDWQPNCIKRIVKGCGGLPLVLEVLGKYLKSTKKREVWEQVGISLLEIDSEKSTGMHKVWAKLSVSYESLGKDEKQMFRDAATFFQGWYAIGDKRPSEQWTLSDAMVAWTARHKQAAVLWKALVDRALVYDVPDNSSIKLHEHFRTLGRRLAENMDEIKVIDVSQHESEEAKDLLRTFCNETHLAIDKVHTIKLQLYRRALEFPSCFSCQVEQLGRKLVFLSDDDILLTPLVCKHNFLGIFVANLHTMKQLQYLQLPDCRLIARKVILPSKLLVLVGASDAKNLSFDASTNLVTLSIVVFGKMLLPHAFLNLKKLYFLHLRAETLEYLPRSFDCLSGLRKCYLNCPVLRELPESFVHLTDLQQLKLTCYRLERLPDSFGSLGNLQVLTVASSTLTRLPDSFGSLGNLLELALTSYNFERLPDSFGSLGNLQVLTIGSNTLESLPESFGSLQNLQVLTLASSTLESLPDSFGSLGNLHKTILYTGKLKRLPDSFGSLRKLRELTLNTTVLEKLPDSFGILGNLQVLQLISDILEKLPDSFVSLGNLQDLQLICNRLEKLPHSFGSLGNLQELKLYSSILERLPDSFGSLENLQELTLITTSLEELPDSFGYLMSLQQLSFRECHNLDTLPDSFSSLERLDIVSIYKSEKLERFRDSCPDPLKKVLQVDV